LRTLYAEETIHSSLPDRHPSNVCCQYGSVLCVAASTGHLKADQVHVHIHLEVPIKWRIEKHRPNNSFPYRAANAFIVFAMDVPSIQRGRGHGRGRGRGPLFISVKIFTMRRASQYQSQKCTRIIHEMPNLPSRQSRKISLRIRGQQHHRPPSSDPLILPPETRRRSADNQRNRSGRKSLK